MSHVYVLNLAEGKKYVGYTERGIVRVLEHLRNNNPKSLKTSTCQYYIPQRKGKQKSNKNKILYGRLCKRKAEPSGFCYIHDKPKYWKAHKKWLEKNEGSTAKGTPRKKTNPNGFKAARWAQKYKPKSWEEAVVEMRPNCTEEDEDRITLEYMKKFGIDNVRGGKWCWVDLPPKTRNELEGLIALL